MSALAFPIPGDPVAILLSKLEGVKAHGAGWQARCPAHQDRTPSLTVARGKDGRVLVKCHAGCTTEAIVGAVGMTMADLFPPREESPYAAPAKTPEATKHTLVKTYDYVDADGALVFQVCRFHPKTFRQRRRDEHGQWIWNLGDVEPVLYRLPEVIEAVAMGRRVYIVEGEKDADAITAEGGGVATTCPMGAGKWRESMSKAFANAADVVILPDNDEPGRAHAEQIAASLTNVGATVRVVQLPNVPQKGDVSDWLEAEGDWDDLNALVGATRIWTRDPLKRARWRLDELLENEAIMRPPCVVVPRLAWRGRSTLLAAAPKAGKSTLLGYVAAQVSRGGMFLENPVDRGTVLLVCPEEYLGDVARRLARFEADATRIHLLDQLPTDPRERPSALAEHIRQVRPDLVIIDTLLSFGRGLIEDENNAVQMQAVTQGLTDLAHHEDTALVIAHHATKASGKYRGSSAIAGGVDAVAELAVPDETNDPTRRDVSAIGRLPIYGFQYRIDGDLLALANATGAPVMQRVVDILRATPGLSLNRLRAAVGGKAETVDEAKDRLMMRGWIKDVGDQYGRAYEVTIGCPSDVVKYWNKDHGA